MQIRMYEYAHTGTRTGGWLDRALLSVVRVDDVATQKRGAPALVLIVEVQQQRQLACLAHARPVSSNVGTVVVGLEVLVLVVLEKP